MIGATMVERVIRLAQAHLGMDVCFVSQFIEGRQIYRAAVGATTDFGLTLGEGPLLPTTYCRRLLDGEIPSLVPDTAENPVLASLPITAARHIGAYVGVPLRLTDGSIYGTFCSMSTHATEGLSERDVQFLRLLADLMTEDLDRDAQFRARHRSISDLLSNGLFSVALQPIVSLTSGLQLGAEALARFPAGYGAPDAVFREADTVGLSEELELLAARKAMRLASVLAEDEFLSVNISPRSILRRGWLDTVPELEQSRLMLEITEHQAVDGYDELKRCLRDLRSRGVRLAIDDVGAGYASLNHVLQLQPDVIKIDRNLVAGLHECSARRSVVRGFVALARDIGASVIGEGVEQPTELAALRDLGVDAAQGYLLGRPTLNHSALRTGPLTPSASSATVSHDQFTGVFPGPRASVGIGAQP